MRHRVPVVIVSVSVVFAAACSRAATSAPTSADAAKFLDEVDRTFTRLSIESNRAGWVAQNFITVDTEAMDARGTQALADASSRFAKDAVRFDKIDVTPEQRRQLDLLKVSLVLATPSNAK